MENGVRPNKPMSDIPEPKPLSLPESPKVKAPGVGSLSFSDVDNKKEIEKKVQVLDAELESAKRQPIKKINFSNVPPPKPKPVAGKSLFVSDDNNNVVKAAVDYVQKNYPTVSASVERIERQIRQLSPLTVDVVMAWGANAIHECGSVATRCATTLKNFSELRSNELVEAALEAARGIQPNHSLLDKVFGKSKSHDMLSFKPRLIVLQSELRTILPDINKFTDLAVETEGRLLLQVAALSAICEVSGASDDTSLEHVTQERRSILAQGANQAKLVGLQLAQTKTLIVDQIARLDQMLNVTLPAFEMANATRKT